MTAAYESEDLHHLVDRLSPAQVRRLRLLVIQDEELCQVASELPAAEPAPAGLLALIGAVDGPADLAEAHDDHIRARVARQSVSAWSGWPRWTGGTSAR